MKTLFKIISGVTFLFLFYSCDSSREEIISTDCNIPAGHQAITDYYNCIKITDSIECDQILVGSWKLKGFSCGLCPPASVDTPCIKVDFYGDHKGNSTYVNNSIDTIHNFTWGIRINDDDIPYLYTFPSIGYLNYSLICPSLFGNSAAPVDGPTYIYVRQ